MKKLLMISVLLLVEAFSVNAQKCCYKYLYTVDNKTGVRSKERDPVRYVYCTFNNNKTVVQLEVPEEDKMRNWDDIFKYKGQENGIYVYHKGEGSNSFLYFNSDYSRLNKFIDMSKYSWATNETVVYEKTDRPDEEKAPVQFY